VQPLIPLEPSKYYHIYNRGNNRDNIFFEERNYLYFMRLYAKYIEPVADTFAYCLLRNHFHALIHIKTHEAETGNDFTIQLVRQHFSNFFNSYAKAINKAYGRTGSLFQERFGRIVVTSDRYFVSLVNYIHRNPEKHGFVTDFRTYPYSSYQALCSSQVTRLKRAEVLEWFGGAQGFTQFHQAAADTKLIHHLITEDFD
jgi:REP element-mobilizing transposase RayT